MGATIKFACGECGSLTDGNTKLCPNCGHENRLYDSYDDFYIANVIFNEMVMMHKISAH